MSYAGIEAILQLNTLLSPVLEKETWSLTLREERRLRVFEKRMLRKIRGVLEK